MKVRPTSGSQYLGLLEQCQVLLQPKQPDYFGDITLTKATFRKYLKEKYSSESNQQLSFKYFSKLCLIQKLFTKVS